MLTLRVVDDPSALAAHVAAWEDLAADATDPNPFHEPWMLLPALEAFGRDSPPRFVLAYASHPPAGSAQPLLCGFFPLEPVDRYRGLPVRHMRLWRYKHCFLGTPLVRRGYAEQCVRALSDWLATDARGAAAMEWREVAADGRFFTALSAAREQLGTSAFRPYERSRALLCRMRDGETYLERVLPKSSRKEFRRLERRLGDLGPVAYRMLERADDAPAWIERFLALEATGWKGERGSALASDPANGGFFRRAALAAAQRGRLMMLALEVGGRAIAMKCNFTAREGAFAFKIAYDEAFAKYSPGTLLELENIRAFHRLPALQWMDSCAAPEHFMANRLWLDRRPLVDLVAAASPGNLLIASLSLLHRLRGGRRRAAAPAPVTP
jgi:CelD/BcsL family acetyltransferase involved in cellulose biosynthesis